MDEDNSYKALMNPGEAENFFDVADLPEFDPNATTKYSRTNSLWLSEFSRLIYRQENDEKPRPATFLTRNMILAAKGWQEHLFFNKDDTQAGLFVHSSKKYAALIFRGTLGLDDTITDAEAVPVRWDGAGYVHEGFKHAFDAVWENLIKPTLLNLALPFFITGHSLGAALATLAAARSLQEPALKQLLLCLYTFGSPRVGDKAFSADLRNLFHCRMVNDEDIVTTLPPPLSIPGVPIFQHVGQLHRIEHDGHLHVFPTDFDSIEMRSPRSGKVNFVEALGGFLNGVRVFGFEPPEPLRDHTPVNYTARLEKVS
jgi:triacylglycerol lipase